MRYHRVTIGLVGVIIVALAAVCFADTGARVAPPADQNQMHLSVVGIVNNAGYMRLVSWFNTDADLVALRKTTHYHPVKAGSAIYDERYRPNISGLPMVRLQDSEGVVLYESSGADIPRSPALLARAIERETVQPCDRTVLPWRRKIEVDRTGPGPDVHVEVTPEDFMEDDYGINDQSWPPPEPAKDDGIPTWVVVLLAITSAGGGFGFAIVSSIKKEMR